MSCFNCKEVVLAETEDWEKQFCYSHFMDLAASDYIYYYGKEITQKNKTLSDFKHLAEESIESFSLRNDELIAESKKLKESIDNLMNEEKQLNIEVNHLNEVCETRIVIIRELQDKNEKLRGCLTRMSECNGSCEGPMGCMCKASMAIKCLEENPE